MISAPLLADNDNDWAASALLLLTRCGDGTLDLCRSGGMALAETKICTCALCNYLLIS